MRVAGNIADRDVEIVIVSMLTVVNRSAYSIWVSFSFSSETSFLTQFKNVNAIIAVACPLAYHKRDPIRDSQIE